MSTAAVAKRKTSASGKESRTDDFDIRAGVSNYLRRWARPGLDFAAIPP